MSDLVDALWKVLTDGSRYAEQVFHLYIMVIATLYALARGRKK